MSFNATFGSFSSCICWIFNGYCWRVNDICNDFEKVKIINATDKILYVAVRCVIDSVLYKLSHPQKILGLFQKLEFNFESRNSFSISLSPPLTFFLVFKLTQSLTQKQLFKTIKFVCFNIRTSSILLDGTNCSKLVFYVQQNTK